MVKLMDAPSTIEVAHYLNDELCIPEATNWQKVDIMGVPYIFADLKFGVVVIIEEPNPDSYDFIISQPITERTFTVSEVSADNIRGTASQVLQNLIDEIIGTDNRLEKIMS